MRTYIFKNSMYQNDEDLAKMVFGGTKEMEIGPAPEFGGKAGILSAEDMFVGSVNSCIMNTFFFFVRRNNLEVLSYHSDVEGRVEKGTEGLRFTKVEVKAKVKIKEPDLVEKIKEMGNLAEKYCLVSRSLACPVHYDLAVETERK